MGRNARATEGNVAKENRVRKLLWFLLKVLLAVPVCLAIWWTVLPAYAWAIGHMAALFLRYVAGYPIEGVTVERAGLLNTSTMLGFSLSGRNPSLPIAQLASNIATYAALILATGGIGLRRRAAIAGIGVAVLCAGHILYLILAFRFSGVMARNPVIPTAIAQAFITLPLVLWIALAYWSQADWLKGFRSGERPPKSPPTQK